jgi:hypothetical protein
MRFILGCSYAKYFNRHIILLNELISGNVHQQITGSEFCVLPVDYIRFYPRYLLLGILNNIPCQILIHPCAYL